MKSYKRILVKIDLLCCPKRFMTNKAMLKIFIAVVLPEVLYNFCVIDIYLNQCFRKNSNLSTNEFKKASAFLKTYKRDTHALTFAKK